MSGFIRLDKDLVNGTQRAQEQAWREEVLNERALWLNCQQAVRDSWTLDGLQRVYDHLAGDAPMALLVKAWRDDVEAQRFIIHARRVVASAAVALLARHRTSVPRVEDQLLRWAYRAATLRADEPPSSLELGSNFVSDDEQSLVRRCFLLLAPYRQDTWCVGAAQDAALALLGLRQDPQKLQSAEGCLRIPVLLARGQEGFVTWLRLERLEQGLGEFFQAPDTAFLPLATDLRQALETAYQHTNKRQPVLKTWDVRWWLADVPPEGGVALQLKGESLQAAAEVGLTLLCRGLCYDTSCVITARVNNDGKLDSVNGVTDAGQPKLRAALQLRSPHGHVTVVVSEGNRLADVDAKDWEAKGVKVVAAADVEGACELASGLPTALQAYFQFVQDMPDRPEELPVYLGTRTRTALYVEPDVLKRERKAKVSFPGHRGASQGDDSKGGPNLTGQVAAEALDIGEEQLYSQPDRQTERRLAWAEARQELGQPRVRAVILAPPGQGKSLLTQMLAREIALGASLDLNRQRTSVQALPLALAVPLNLLTSRGIHTGETPAEALRASLVDTLKEMGCALETARYLADHAHEERCWLFLDALDEVSSNADTEMVLARFFAVLKEREWRCRVIITSRPYGYRERCLPFDVAEYRLAPFSSSQQGDFVTRWGGPGNGPNRMSALLARSPAVQLAAQNPFLLTLVCAIGEREEVPHDISRTHLYGTVLQLVLGGAARAAEWLPLLEELAWTLFQRNPRDLRMPGQELLEFLRDSDNRPPAASGTSDLSGMEKATLLSEELRKKRVLVRVAASGAYIFAHRSFAEYLTACYLAGRINKQGWTSDVPGA